MLSNSESETAMIFSHSGVDKVRSLILKGIALLQSDAGERL